MIVAAAIANAAPITHMIASKWLNTTGSKPITIMPNSAMTIAETRTNDILSRRKIVANKAEKGTYSWVVMAIEAMLPPAFKPINIIPK